ncbi:hypothetical protein WJX84_000505 [Apatococcus fuscideae]|uniref:Uncharacterized protein n=1 Tax=Apatococcus fuscideae TaxID=2026836 RepID=A0AAW1S5J8_9CHLO
MVYLVFVCSALGNELTAALAAAPFVATDDGTYKQASQLFDPDNRLFVSIFADEPLFPSARFRTPAWRKVLKAAGLRCIIDTDVFKIAAQHLSDRFHSASELCKTSALYLPSRGCLGALIPDSS